MPEGSVYPGSADDLKASRNLVDRRGEAEVLGAKLGLDTSLRSGALLADELAARLRPHYEHLREHRITLT